MQILGVSRVLLYGFIINVFRFFVCCYRRPLSVVVSQYIRRVDTGDLVRRDVEKGKTYRKYLEFHIYQLID